MKPQRGVSYPAFTIEQSLEFVEKVHKTYGTSYRATREEITKSLSLSSHMLNQKFGTAVQYGLLDMQSGKGYKVTELSVRYFRPINDEQKRSSLLEALNNPPLYAALISSFNGQILPPEKPLGNILLQKHSVSDSASESAAKIFIANLNFLGLLSNDNTLNMGGQANEAEKEEEYSTYTETETAEIYVPIKQIEQQNKDNAQKPKSQEQPINNSGNLPPFNIILKNKRIAQLIVPDDATSEDFEYISKWLEMSKYNL